MIPAATKCVPIPDPELIKSCCHHLLFVIPLQYLCLLPRVTTREGGGERSLPGEGGRLAG